MAVYASNITNNIHVYGTNPNTASGQQTTIIMGSGADTVTRHPHDAEGNRTINTNLGIGGAGASPIFSSTPLDVFNREMLAA